MFGLMLLCAIAVTTALADEVTTQPDQTEPIAEQPPVIAEAGTPLSTFFAGQQNSSQQSDTEPISMSTGAMITRVVLGLGLVLGLLGAVLFLYKKATLGRPNSLGNAGIQILAQRGVGQKSQLAVVRVGGQTLLLGMTPNQISTLGQLNSSSEAMESTTNQGTISSRQGSFQDQTLVSAQATSNEMLDEMNPSRGGFEQTLAGEVKRVRDSLWTSLKRLES